MLKKILEGDVPTSNQLGFYHRIVFVFYRRFYGGNRWSCDSRDFVVNTCCRK